jgi:hypothetical protein
MGADLRCTLVTDSRWWGEPAGNRSATGRDDSITIFTASSLNSGVNFKKSLHTGSKAQE